jgi:hypothetical protein
LQEFFHGRKSGGDDRYAGITVASKHNSARRWRQRARSRGRKRSGV